LQCNPHLNPLPGQGEEDAQGQVRVETCVDTRVFNVVLVEPEIPPNTGNIGRLCLATGSTLHLVKLDYWQEVPVQLWETFEALQRAQPAGMRYFYLTTKSQRAYYKVRFRENDFLVFGRETKGLPEHLLVANADHCITIPMQRTRSLNLATAVAVILFEAVRQQQAF